MRFGGQVDRPVTTAETPEDFVARVQQPRNSVQISDNSCHKLNVLLGFSRPHVLVHYVHVLVGLPIFV